MQPHLFPFLSSFSIFFLMTLTFFIAPSSVFASDDDRYLNCSGTFQCGNISGIGYPFWGSNRPDYCGFPGFELNCTDQSAVIKIMQLDYQLLEINDVSHTLKLARTDFIGNICPTHFLNASLNHNLFNYPSETQNITVYYGCPLIPVQFYPFGLSNQVSCTINETDIEGYYLTRSINMTALGSFSFASCEHIVIVQADRSNVQSIEINPTQGNLVRVLDQGFGLEYWVSNDMLCETCRTSGGWCGFNRSTSAFSCYCPDQAHEFNCSSSPSDPPGTVTVTGTGDGSKKDVSLPVGLGIGGAAIAAIVLGFFCLVITKKRKRKVAETQSKDLPFPPPSAKGIPPLSMNLSQSIPSYPSSKSDLEKGSTYFGVQVFSYSQLEEATNNFDSSKELGDGGFGIVYYGVLRDGRAVAVKRLYENNIRRAEQFMNEIEILAQMRHQNLVMLYGCTSRHSRELLLVYEYIPNGTVADHLHGKRSNSSLLTWPVRLSIAIGTANALAYLHASDVVHRDVKSNNILLDDNFRVKVADFGLSRLFPSDVTHVSTAPQGTPGYVDPEYHQCYQLTDKSDVYSFGVVLIELLSSLQAVDTSRHRHDINLANMAITKIQNRAFNELVDPRLGFEKDYTVRRMATSVAELAFRCLQQERDMRPTMEEVLKGLKRIESENFGIGKAEVVDIGEDEIEPLKHAPPPLSPDSVVTDKWVSSSNTSTSF